MKERYGAEGFNLIAFPCNQFGGQAPGSSEEERTYAIKKFGFEFDVYVRHHVKHLCFVSIWLQDKIDVNGLTAHPLYKYLKKQQPVSFPEEAYGRRVGAAGDIEWNYTKFLIDREGKAIRRYRSAFDPLDFEGDVDLSFP